MAKLTQGASICHVYLSYKMWYTWQVAGVGAGYIGKDKLTRDNLSQASRAGSLWLGAWGLGLPPLGA